MLYFAGGLFFIFSYVPGGQILVPDEILFTIAAVDAT